MISTQWFLKMQPHGRGGARGRARRAAPIIIPAEWKKTYDHFLENIQDWCVSRQLWWGHRIPAWHGAERRDHASPASGPAECDEAGVDAGPGRARHLVLERALAVLDARLARATPRAREVLPAPSDLETGYDILFFWVARMMMFGPALHEGGRRSGACSSRAHRRRDRREDEQGEGQRHRPARPHLRRDVHRDGRRRRCPALPRPRRSPSSRRRTRRRPRWAAASPRSAPTRSASRSRPTRRATSASRSRPSASRATATS